MSNQASEVIKSVLYYMHTRVCMYTFANVYDQSEALFLFRIWFYEVNVDFTCTKSVHRVMDC